MQDDVNPSLAKQDMPVLEISVDQDQLASSSWLLKPNDLDLHCLPLSI